MYTGFSRCHSRLFPVCRREVMEELLDGAMAGGVLAWGLDERSGVMLGEASWR
jgi:hypothetical protein